MTLKQLIYFCKLAELQSYTRAAQELFISQPSLSYTMKELEKEFSAPLFEKAGHGNKICLSQCGKIFLPYAKEALANIEEGKNAVSQYVISEKNVLNIGYIHTFSLSAITDLFNEFQFRDFPIVLRKKISNVNFELLEQLRRQQLDFAFCLELANGITGFPSFYQDLYIVVSKKHPIAQQTYASFEDIKNEPYVWVSHANTINSIIENIYCGHNCELKISSRAGNLNVALAYVLNGGCYTITPKLSTTDFSELAVLPFDQSPLKRPIYFAWKENRVFDEKKQLFFQFIEEKFRSSSNTQTAMSESS